MRTTWSVAVLTLLCCSLPPVADRAAAAQFEIQHDTAYARMILPGTLGESTDLTWDLVDDGMWIGFQGAEPLQVQSISGVAHIGPLLSLDAERNPDGSLGDTDYVFGEGHFELQLVLNLLDGTLQTMRMHGATGPLNMRVQDDGEFLSGSFSLSVPHAKVDPDSAALFGMKRRVRGELPYFVDVSDIGGTNNRDVALFGSIDFDYTPVRQSKTFDLQPVSEPALLSLVGLALAGVARRARRH